jgi:hypothetical protein
LLVYYKDICAPVDWQIEGSRAKSARPFSGISMAALDLNKIERQADRDGDAFSALCQPSGT